MFQCHNNYSFCSSLNHNSAKMLKCIETEFLSTLFLPIRALIELYKSYDLVAPFSNKNLKYFYLIPRYFPLKYTKLTPLPS